MPWVISFLNRSHLVKRIAQQHVAEWIVTKHCLKKKKCHLFFHMEFKYKLFQKQQLTCSSDCQKLPPYVEHLWPYYHFCFSKLPYFLTCTSIYLTLTLILSSDNKFSWLRVLLVCQVQISTEEVFSLQVHENVWTIAVGSVPLVGICLTQHGQRNCLL